MQDRNMRSRKVLGLKNDLEKLIVGDVCGILIFGRDTKVLDYAR